MTEGEILEIDDSEGDALEIDETEGIDDELGIPSSTVLELIEAEVVELKKELVFAAVEEAADEDEVVAEKSAITFPLLSTGTIDTTITSERPIAAFLDPNT